MNDLENEEPSANKELLVSKGITIFMGDVTETTMIPLVEWILASNLSNKPHKELTLGICSPGGDLNACFALIDVMKGSRGSYGKEHELFATVKEFELTTKRMITHYKKCTGLTEKLIREKLLPPHDVWLDANQAKKLGICDKIQEMGMNG